MKQKITKSIKQVFKDRPLAVAIIVLFLVTIIFCIYVGFAIQISELQVVVRYTSFGITNFYRNQWFYLLTFIAFGLIVAVTNTAIAAKLYQLKNRHYALFFIWLSVVLMVMAAITAWSVLRLAALS